MTDLIERLEKATGPNFRLEQEIMWEVYAVPPEHRSDNDKPKAYTASIDVALTLVPQGMDWALDAPCTNSKGETVPAEATLFGEDDYPSAYGATPAIAICIAALKAREANDH